MYCHALPTHLASPSTRTATCDRLGSQLRAPPARQREATQRKYGNEVGSERHQLLLVRRHSPTLLIAAVAHNHNIISIINNRGGSQSSVIGVRACLIFILNPHTHR